MFLWSVFLSIACAGTALAKTQMVAQPISPPDYVGAVRIFEDAEFELRFNALTFHGAEPFSDPKRHYLAILSVISGLVTELEELIDYDTQYLPLVETYLVFGLTKPKLVADTGNKVLNLLDDRMRDIVNLTRQCPSHNSSNECNRRIHKTVMENIERYREPVLLLINLIDLCSEYLDKKNGEFGTAADTYTEAAYLISGKKNMVSLVVKARNIYNMFMNGQQVEGASGRNLFTDIILRPFKILRPFFSTRRHQKS